MWQDTQAPPEDRASRVFLLLVCFLAITKCHFNHFCCGTHTQPINPSVNRIRAAEKSPPAAQHHKSDLSVTELLTLARYSFLRASSVKSRPHVTYKDMRTWSTSHWCLEGQSCISETYLCSAVRKGWRVFNKCSRCTSGQERDVSRRPIRSWPCWDCFGFGRWMSHWKTTYLFI